MNTTASIVGISRHRISIDGNGVTTLAAPAGCPLRYDYCLNPHSWNGKAEAVRVLLMMLRWPPARFNENSVASKCELVVAFRLEK